MATIKAFRALRYNQEKINLEKVIAPPYDVISPDEQNNYYDKDPKNIIRLILAREEDRYSASKKYFQDWQLDQSLVRETDEAIYPLEQSFISNDGTVVNRKGFIALIKIEEFEKGIVLPHEKTLSKAKEDRLKLLRTTEANFSQIFGLFSDAEGLVQKEIQKELTEKPICDVEFQEVKNKIWKITNKNIIDSIVKIMSSKQILIADGHHRYETALNYRNEKRKEIINFTGNESFNFVLMFFTNLNDDGLVIYPTHRAVHSIENFNWQKIKSILQNDFDIIDCKSKQEMIKTLQGFDSFSYGVIESNPAKFSVLHLKNSEKIKTLLSKSLPNEIKNLDVVLLHEYILRDLIGISDEAQAKKLNINYLQKIADCVTEVENKKVNIAFIVNSTKINQVRQVAESGNIMPQKSTFFYPKLISGFIMNKLD
ncbi:MAG: DUF1015 domain-containing protein [Bacteroidota bacterium]